MASTASQIHWSAQHIPNLSGKVELPGRIEQLESRVGETLVRVGEALYRVNLADGSYEELAWAQGLSRMRIVSAREEGEFFLSALFPDRVVLKLAEAQEEFRVDDGEELCDATASRDKKTGEWSIFLLTKGADGKSRIVQKSSDGTRKELTPQGRPWARIYSAGGPWMTLAKEGRLKPFETVSLQTSMEGKGLWGAMWRSEATAIPGNMAADPTGIWAWDEPRDDGMCGDLITALTHRYGCFSEPGAGYRMLSGENAFLFARRQGPLDLIAFGAYGRPLANLFRGDGSRPDPSMRTKDELLLAQGSTLQIYRKGRSRRSAYIIADLVVGFGALALLTGLWKWGIGRIESRVLKGLALVGTLGLCAAGTGYAEEFAFNALFLPKQPTG